MVVTCHSCASKFRVDDSKIGARGVKVRCAKCQTMIIVKPEADQAIGLDDVATQVTAPPRAPEPEMPAMPVFDDEHQAPTRVQQMPANVLADLRAQAAAAQPNPAAPPPLVAKAPPPLKAPPPSAPAPVPRAPALDDTGDLFSDPFAKSTPASPPADQQRFVDAGGGLEQPSLELDLGAGIPSSPPPTSTPLPDPLAELPRFDSPDEPQFSGGISSEGTVTKPVSLRELEAQSQSAGAAPQPLAQLDLQPASSLQKTKEGDSVAAITDRERMRAAAAAGKPSKAVALLGRAAILVLCLAGIAGELIVFRAGGLQGLIGHASRTGDGAALRRVTVYPVLAQDGTTFMVVRGEVQTFGNQNKPPQVEISVGGKVLATQSPGHAIDDAALVLRGEIIPKPAAHPQTFRFAWKDTRPLDELKAALSVRVVP
jgi:predicted Zn finger-like uncharacterized protein